MSKCLFVTTLNDVTFQLGDDVISNFSSRKAEALLIYLIIERGNPH